MRFRKSVRIAPGVRINFSGSGISTSFGGRGATLNVGRKGTRVTVGIPGTGISYSSRIGGGASTGSSGGGEGIGGGGSSTEAGAAQGGGCAGAGCLGLFLLVLIGMCGAPDEPSPRYSPAYTPSYGASATTDHESRYSAPVTTEPRDWLYIHGTLNVRAAPNRNATIVRTLHRGDLVQLGPRSASGWAPLYSGGSVEGYVYRASDLVRSRAPSTSSSAGYGSGGSSSASGRTRARRSSAADRGYYTGPRGGCYTYSASGRKRYVDRSYCN